MVRYAKFSRPSRQMFKLKFFIVTFIILLLNRFYTKCDIALIKSLYPSLFALPPIPTGSPSASRWAD